jgi:hypothetical protein
MAKQNEMDLGELERREHEVEQSKNRERLVYKSINIAFEVLSDKILLLIATLVAAGFFAWTLYDPSPMKIVTSCLFTAGVFWPILWRYMKQKR